MRTTRTVCALLCLVCLLLCTGAGTRLGRSPRGAHHRPLTDAQKADQNLQFMLSLYRSAAEPDGRTKQHRKFGSNTVRLLRPAAVAVYRLPTSRDHHFTFTVRYNLDTHPSEQLIRASFIHLRSSSGPSPPRSSAPPPRCRARITSVGSDILVTMEPHHRWTETDITAHVLRGWSQEEEAAGGGGGGDTGHVRLRAQYRCTEPPGRSRRQRGRSRTPQLEAPALLLYLEEAREVKDWMGELLGREGRDILRRMGQWQTPAPRLRRRRRSKDPDPQDPSLAALKNAPTSASSFATAPAASIISSIPGGEGARRRGGAPKNRCKLHSFRLSFDELGWGHYFIAPPVYNPRFCRGDCPRVLHYGYHSPNHAIIQTLISQMGVGDVPPPSCVPYKYMPMSLLVVHKKKVEYRELDDMVAESCTCR